MRTLSLTRGHRTGRSARVVRPRGCWEMVRYVLKYMAKGESSSAVMTEYQSRGVPRIHKLVLRPGGEQ